MNKQVKEFADFYTVLDSLILEEIPPPLEDGDITVSILAERAGCGPRKAQTVLRRWERDGKVEYIGRRREARGHPVKAWRLK